MLRNEFYAIIISLGDINRTTLNDANSMGSTYHNNTSVFSFLLQIIYSATIHYFHQHLQKPKNKFISVNILTNGRKLNTWYAILSLRLLGGNHETLH